jgi:pSer/pThr/pTyr-binding forkhead associated (FHA) protein
VPLTGESLTFGRTEAAEVVISGDQGLSRRHATVRQRGGRVWVFDEGSTNGSHVGGVRVGDSGLPLSDGDEIRIGNSTIVRVEVKNSSAEAGRASAAPPPVILAAAVAAALLLLGGLGFALYSMKREAEPSEAVVGVRPNSDDVPEMRLDATGAPAGPPAQTTAPAAPSPAATPEPASTSILSVGPLAEPPAEAEPPAAGRRLYRQMSEEEKLEFIKRRAQHIAVMMGRRPYSFTPEALTHIKFWLDAFARRVGNHRTGLWGGDTIYILERGKRHAPTITRAFHEHNVPVVVGLYIPFIETEYTNISSDNFAGAAGLFQFLGPTAEHYGVPRSERTNVPRMAGAAARYFRDNILSFGDDPMSVALSIAGYNRAPESVKRDLRNVLNAPNNEDKERSFWTLIANQGKLDEYFQRENVNYVPRFFAAAILGETPWAFGIQMRPLSTYTEPGAEAADPAP